MSTPFVVPRCGGIVIDLHDSTYMVSTDLMARVQGTQREGSLRNHGDPSRERATSRKVGKEVAEARHDW